MEIWGEVKIGNSLPNLLGYEDWEEEQDVDQNQYIQHLRKKERQRQEGQTKGSKQRPGRRDWKNFAENLELLRYPYIFEGSTNCKVLCDSKRYLQTKKLLLI